MEDNRRKVIIEEHISLVKEPGSEYIVHVSAKIQRLEINLNTSQNESALLENKPEEFSLAESSLKEKPKQISNEKEETAYQLIAEESMRLNLKSYLFELNNRIKLLEEERTCKSLESDELKKRIANLKIEHEAQIQELERKTSSELLAVQKRLESISNEKLLLTKIQVLEKEKEELSSDLAEKSRKIVSLSAVIEKKTNDILCVQEKLSAKTLDLDNLNPVNETLTEELTLSYEW
ncbi:hypothetical protein AVEN_257908-1 [Araneus ventricosus]|uniref:Uncharacterized protein n=1 Tax=Araneus ventricosus TaxID=182803 RepID=A0A4Y2VLG2_ARAVE|nr:hypothetical protein AVEN_257908-1 [Araneus ventricosus]